MTKRGTPSSWIAAGSWSGTRSETTKGARIGARRDDDGMVASVLGDMAAKLAGVAATDEGGDDEP